VSVHCDGERLLALVELPSVHAGGAVSKVDASMAWQVQKVADLQAQIDAYRDLSTSLAFDELEPAGSAR